MISTTDALYSGHEPVLLKEVLELMVGHRVGQGGTFCDATVGLGGHARAVIDRAGPSARFIGLDRDRDALAVARQVLQPFAAQVTLVHAPFSRVRAVLDELGAIPVDGFLVDLGVSSPQLDRAERGFSFQRSGPLDMRMDASGDRPTALELIRRLDVEELSTVLRDLGEERYHWRIAQRLKDDARGGRLETTAPAHEDPPGHAHLPGVAHRGQR